MPYSISRDWTDVQEEAWPQFTRILSRVRASDGANVTLQADRVVWGYAWAEHPTLFRTSDTAQARAYARWNNVRATYVWAGLCGRRWYQKLPMSPAAVMDAILEQEDARPE